MDEAVEGFALHEATGERLAQREDRQVEVSVADLVQLLHQHVEVVQRQCLDKVIFTINRSVRSDTKNPPVFVEIHF